MKYFKLRHVLALTPGLLDQLHTRRHFAGLFEVLHDSLFVDREQIQESGIPVAVFSDEGQQSVLVCDFELTVSLSQKTP